MDETTGGHQLKRPMLCQVCGRFAEVQWHSISRDEDDAARCETERTADDVGYWLCTDVCHQAVHELMKEDTGPGRSVRAIGRMIERLASAVTTGQRSYRRQAFGGK